MRLLIGVLLLATATAGCGGDDAPLDTGDDDGTAALPADGEYRSVEVTEDGVPRDLVPGTVISLRFDAGQLGASAGCNTMGGDYRVVDDVLEVEAMFMTEMGCDVPRDDQDRWLADLLSARPTVAASTDGFTLASSDRTTEIRFVERSVVEPDAVLVGTEWQVTGFIDGEVAMSGNVDEPGVLLLEDNGYAGGFDGCNRLGYDPAGDGLRYSVDGDVIRFEGNAISTLLACEDAADYQQRFQAVLSGDVTWEIVGPNLTLTAADGRGVTYRVVDA